MSTGRCSTQFLARLLAKGDPNTMVVHEGAGPNFKPALAFRQKNFDEIIANTHQLQNQFSRIDKQLTTGGSFIDTGWPAYSWGPYFQERYGDKFQFAHLVRNPYSVAASMSTHSLLEYGDGSLSKFGIIRPDNPRAYFPEFAGAYPDFSMFERGLYHWLEVNTFLKSQADTVGYLGKYLFEDMYFPDNNGAIDLWEKCGFDPGAFQEMPAYDKYNCRNRGEITVGNRGLGQAVFQLALALGYEQEYLELWSNTDLLTEYYRNTRLGRPTD